uniref:Aa_trans domain-containing protein n=1 Tax=Haemonchus placei TaxID=6290 RepID=A0A0N4WQ64_HAEPC
LPLSISSLDVPTWVKHLSCIFLGLIILPDWIQRNDVRIAIIFGLPLLLLALLQTPLPSKGETTICACILSIVCIRVCSEGLSAPNKNSKKFLDVFRQYLLPAHDFLAIRGILMIFAMKVSALTFDSGSNCETKDIIPILAYIFGPATSVFGPFHTFDDYMNSLNRRTIKAILHSMVLVAVAFCFLSYSSCIGILLPDGSILTDYITAQSFRTSHYFVCMLSEGLVLLSGIKLSTCSPLSVEVPRSLVEVVVAWNIPMHRFLHTCKLYTIALLCSVRGGISFERAIVVLSKRLFVMFIQISYRLAMHYQFLSLSLSALYYTLLSGIEYPEGFQCAFELGRAGIGHWQTLFINVVFFAVSVYQLIYLGAPFDGEGAEIGYEMSHTVATWRRHRFFGHGITAGIAVLSFCI